MIGRQIVGGVAGLGAMSIFAVGLVWSGHSPSGPAEAPSKLTLVEQLNAERPVDRRWTVVGAVSFDRVLVVDVATQRVEDARAIASKIVDPVRELEYDEILLYFRRSSDRKAAAERRIQWTPGGGFVELVMASR